MLVSAKHQHESAIGRAMSPHSWTSLPPPSPSHFSRLSQSPDLSSLSHAANSPRLSISHMAVWLSPCYCLHRPKETVAAVWLTLCLSRIPQGVSQRPCRDKPCGEATGWERRGGPRTIANATMGLEEDPLPSAAWAESKDRLLASTTQLMCSPTSVL